MSAVSLALDDLPALPYGSQVGLSPREYVRLTDKSRADAEGMARRVLERLGCGDIRGTVWLLEIAWTSDAGAEYPAIWTYSVDGMRPHTDHPPKDAVTVDLRAARVLPLGDTALMPRLRYHFGGW